MSSSPSEESNRHARGNPEGNLRPGESTEDSSDHGPPAKRIRGHVDSQPITTKKPKIDDEPPSKETTENNIRGGQGQDAKIKESSVPSDLSTGTNREEAKAQEHDKIVSNTVIVAQHYNTLVQKGLTHRSQSRIMYMRNFNNWVKSMLINEYLEKARQGKSHGAPFKVLDLCCGKGGDLLKWSKANITYLICADVADISVDQCQSRYNDLFNKSSNNKGFTPVFRAEFIKADCSKTRLKEKFKDASVQLDLVSCQFAFHYSFESLPQAECLLRNAAESLRPGGYFIGTMPDANELVRRWQNSDSQKFGNEVYQVEFQCEEKTKPPLFGAKYNFRLENVVNCPEFLVHLPTLVKLASKFGLKLVMFERFENFYKLMKDEGRSLLGKMRALETYPPCHEAPLLGKNPEDYRHAAQYMQKSKGHRKIGTLSLPEWEVTSLYVAFAFQKMKTTLNAEGRPEYPKL